MREATHLQVHPYMLLLLLDFCTNAMKKSAREPRCTTQPPWQGVMQLTLSNLRIKHIKLLRLPPQHPRKQRRGILRHIQKIRKRPRPNVLILFPLGPRTDGDVMPFDGDVRETCFLEPLAVLLCGGEVQPDFLPGLTQVIAPLDGEGGWVFVGFVGSDRDVDFVEVEVAAGL
jgi:hypothetical protein